MWMYDSSKNHKYEAVWDKFVPEFSCLSYDFNDASHFLRTDINICHCLPEMKFIAAKLRNQIKI